MVEPSKLRATFAENGDVSTIPSTQETVGSGQAAWDVGFPEETSKPIASGGKAPRRADFNALFKMLTDAVRWTEHGNVWSYDVATDYMIGTFATYITNNRPELFLCTANNGPSFTVKTPTDTTAWAQITKEGKINPAVLTGTAKLSIEGAVTGNVTGNLTGNADTATKLQTARSINGTSFDGSSAITTEKWGTARNITVQDADGTNSGAVASVNGESNVALKLPATIKASITGNADTATRAINDSNGNNIAETYATQTVMTAETSARTTADATINAELDTLVHLDADGKFYINVEV